MTLKVVDPYRKPDNSNAVELEHVGPRYVCPACDHCSIDINEVKRVGHYDYGCHVSIISHPEYCDGDRPIRISGWWIFGTRCTRKDPHLHQRCSLCGCKWTCLPANADDAK